MIVRVVFGPAENIDAQVFIGPGGSVTETGSSVKTVCVECKDSMLTIESARLEALRDYIRSNNSAVYVLPESAPDRMIAYLSRGTDVTTDQSFIEVEPESEPEPESESVDEELDELEEVN